MDSRLLQAQGSPEQFGRFEIVATLGSGGMAEVFLAKERGPLDYQRTLVIKRILPHLSRDPDFVSMFASEAKLSAHLSHGNIVQVFEFGVLEGTLYLTMEHVDGIDLQRLLNEQRRTKRKLPPEVAVFIALEVLQALEYAHCRPLDDGKVIGLIHRDLSPSNILLSRIGEVKLCDFGIAKATTLHTTSGRLKGKVGYMSPEQASGSAIDGRSDLFSLGIVLWEMLASARLFSGGGDLSTLELVRQAEIPNLPPLEVPLEERLKGVVRRALMRDPESRYQTAKAFAAQLQDYLRLAGLSEPCETLRRIVQRLPGLAAAAAASQASPRGGSSETRELDKSREVPFPLATTPEARPALPTVGTGPDRSGRVRVPALTWLAAAFTILTVGAALAIALAPMTWRADHAPAPSRLLQRPAPTRPPPPHLPAVPPPLRLEPFPASSEANPAPLQTAADRPVHPVRQLRKAVPSRKRTSRAPVSTTPDVARIPSPPSTLETTIDPFTLSP